MGEKETQVIKVAQELFVQQPDWVTFFREVLGVGLWHFMLPLVGVGHDHRLHAVARLASERSVSVVWSSTVFRIRWPNDGFSAFGSPATTCVPPVSPPAAPATGATGLGEIYQYGIHPKKGSEDKYNAMDLRTIQDWIVARQLYGTPGVAEVNSFGGILRQYEGAVSPDRLRAMNVTIPE